MTRPKTDLERMTELFLIASVPPLLRDTITDAINRGATAAEVKQSVAKSLRRLLGHSPKDHSLYLAACAMAERLAASR